MTHDSARLCSISHQRSWKCDGSGLARDVCWAGRAIRPQVSSCRARETELFAAHSTAWCSTALPIGSFEKLSTPGISRLRTVVPYVLTSTLEMFSSHLHICPFESRRMMMLLKTHRRILKAFRTKFKEFQKLVCKKDRRHFFRPCKQIGAVFTSNAFETFQDRLQRVNDTCNKVLHGCIVACKRC